MLSIRRLTAQGWVVAALLLGIAAVRVFALVHGVRVEANQYDINRFYAIAQSAGVPYRDYPVEYPPLTVLLLKAVAAVLHSRNRFGDGILLLSLASEIAIGWILWRTWGLRAALVFLVIDSVLIALLITRLDLVSTALTVAAVAAALRRRPVLGAILIAIGCGVKLWPLPVALVLLMVLRDRERLRYGVTLAACTAAGVAGWLLVGGSAAIQQVLTFRGATGWQVESVPGSFIHLVTREVPFSVAGSNRFGTVPAAVPVILFGVAAVITLWVLSRATRNDIGPAWIASVGAFLACATLLSPQFVVWLFPAAAICWVTGHRSLTIAVALVAVLTLAETEYLTYPVLLSVSTKGLLLVALRNAVLVATVVLALYRLAQRRPAPDAVRARAQLAA
jgi:hypothetical protein